MNDALPTLEQIFRATTEVLANERSMREHVHPSVIASRSDEITAEEAGVFQIPYLRFPIMVTAFEAFEAVTGRWVSPRWSAHVPLLEAMIDRYPTLEAHDFSNFVAFGQAFADLSPAECFAIWMMQEMHNLRAGVLRIETQPAPQPAGLLVRLACRLGRKAHRRQVRFRQWKGRALRRIQERLTQERIANV